MCVKENCNTQANPPKCILGMCQYHERSMGSYLRGYDPVRAFLGAQLWGKHGKTPSLNVRLGGAGDMTVLPLLSDL